MLNDKIKIVEGTCYHVYNRGNNRADVFFETSNYLHFLKQFEKYVVPHCEIYAYCLMPNHFHFFIKVLDKVYFEKGIKNFFISYSKSINSKYDRVGSLFQGRYKAKEVISDSHYTRIITYIHQNPVTAGLVIDLQNYPYSSYGDYIESIPSFLSRSEVLNWFGNFNNFIDEHKF